MTSERMRSKKPNWVDAYVGSRIRLRRRQLGLSQTELGKALGISYQQVQKYGLGVNRIGASRLVAIGEYLTVSISFFFPDDKTVSLSHDGSAEPGSTGPQPKVTPEAIALAKLFAEINDPSLRKKIVSLVRILSESHYPSNTKR